MALSIDQITAASYEAVLNEKRKPSNQWAEHPFMKEAERVGFLVVENFGRVLEATLDYRRNPDAGFTVNDNDPTSSTKTEVLTAAQYDPAQLVAPFVWYRMDEVKNPSENQKVDFVKNGLSNTIDSHDDVIEEAIFVSSTNGFLGLPTHIPTDGQGTVGGISAIDEAWWRNPADTYQPDGSDIEATFNELWNTASKGSGSSMTPKMLFSGSEPHVLYEGQLTPLVRFNDTKEGDVGFKILAYKTARYSFSHYGDDKVYFLNPASIKMVVSKGNFRDLGEKQILEDGKSYKRLVYSAVQTMNFNKSRLAVASEATS